MRSRLSRLRQAMLTSAMAIVIFAVALALVFKKPADRPAPVATKDVSEDLVASGDATSGSSSGPSGYLARDQVDAIAVDAIARAKIDVLRAQRSAPHVVQSATHQPRKAEKFDATVAASAALTRLIHTRKCERLSGSLSAGTKTSCPTGHPLALATASGYNDLLVEQTVSELAFLKQLALYSRSENQADPYSLPQVAKAYIQHPDDNVKEQALAIAALLPDRDGKEALVIAAKAVESTVSGPLALQALQLLSRHRDHDPEGVDKTVMTALKKGGWDVRDAVASQLLPFITPSTKAEFAKILAAEPVRSKVALHIRLNLEEFDRMERL